MQETSRMCGFGGFSAAEDTDEDEHKDTALSGD